MNRIYDMNYHQLFWIIIENGNITHTTYELYNINQKNKLNLIKLL